MRRDEINCLVTFYVTLIQFCFLGQAGSEEMAAAADEEDGEEEEDDDEEPHVLNSEGVATPWRTLGSLAQRVATPHHEDDGEEEEEEEGADDEARKSKSRPRPSVPSSQSAFRGRWSNRSRMAKTAASGQ